MENVCPTCQRSFQSFRALSRHRRLLHGYRECYSCPECHRIFLSPENLSKHVQTHFVAVNGHSSAADQRPCFPSDPMKCPDFSASFEYDVTQLLTQNWQYIRSHIHISKRVLDKYVINLLRKENWQTFYDLVESVLSEQIHAMKVNVSFGFILQNSETHEKVFYYASNNNMLFEDGPRVLNSKRDIEQFVTDLRERDVLKYCIQHRTNTKFTVRAVTNCLLHVYKLPAYRIGCPVYVRPHVKRLKSVVTFATNRYCQPFTDNFCFFRCYCKSSGTPTNTFEAEVRRLAHSWAGFRDQTNGPVGVTMDELSLLEKWLRCNINVYGLKKDRETGNFYATQLFTSASIFQKTLNLHREGQHFCYISKLDTYTKSWQCKKCKSVFNKLHHRNRHTATCTNGTNIRYRGGGFGPKKTLFDRLSELGFKVDKELQYYPYRAFYDFECCFAEPGIDKKGVRAMLKPISVSICSNVPGFEEPKCFVEPEPAVLIVEMFGYLGEIGTKGTELMSEKFEHVFRELESWLTQREILLLAAEQETAMHEAELDDLTYVLAQAEPLMQELKDWLKKLVVLSFNGARFDIPLIREYIFPYLQRRYSEKELRLIKKNNSYLMIDMPDFRLLDIAVYVAPHTSYAAWLRCWDVGMEKSHFPYSWLRNYGQLDATKELVPREAFFNEMKGGVDLPEDEYEKCQKIWQEKGFTSMRDWLVYYNNLDVLPGVVAAGRMFDFWKKLGIDAFHGSEISLPGLAYAHMANSVPSHTIIPICGPEHAEIYQLIRENITGGLSITIHRYHQRGVTKLPNGKPCRKIMSFDASSMYLSALGKKLGTGLFRVWKAAAGAVSVTSLRRSETRNLWEQLSSANDQLVIESKSWLKYGRAELEWMEYMSHVLGRKIEHRFNGRQKTFHRRKEVRYSVDGYDPVANMVFQFHGCFFHGHKCWLNKKGCNEERQAADEEVERYLRSLGLTVLVMRECDWKEMKARTPAVQEFLDEYFELGIQQRSLTCGHMIDHIRSGQFFGFVECDVEVPAWNTELLELFADFPPICKNVLVSKEDVGPFMKAYAEANDCFRQPRRCLISSYFGEKILLISPLLKWYLEHGLVITRIYQCIEMRGKTCFEHLRDEVADHRRLADRDPGYKPLGTMWKLVGNNYYGKPLTDVTRFKDVKISSRLASTSKLVNSKRFYRLDEINETEEAYEVSMNKARITISQPNHISSMILGYAKLRNLEFVYDFLYKYLQPGSFKLICSDTDSIMAAYASEDVDDLVKPELAAEYNATGKKAFLVTDTYSERTPGIYHVECEGDGAIALCPKTYIVWKDEDETCKLSSKGLSKTTNHFTKSDYQQVLETGERASGKNITFRKFGPRLYQFEQERSGICYLLTKRKTLDDGVTTIPLDL